MEEMREKDILPSEMMSTGTDGICEMGKPSTTVYPCWSKTTDP